MWYYFISATGKGWSAKVGWTANRGMWTVYTRSEAEAMVERGMTRDYNCKAVEIQCVI